VSRVTEIAVFVRLAAVGGMEPEKLARAIRRRWPEASEEEVRDALARAGGEALNAEEQLAMELAAAAILRG
jgi:hypothetical protein